MATIAQVKNIAREYHQKAKDECNAKIDKVHQDICAENSALRDQLTKLQEDNADLKSELARLKATLAKITSLLLQHDYGIALLNHPDNPYVLPGADVGSRRRNIERTSNITSSLPTTNRIHNLLGQKLAPCVAL